MVWSPANFVKCFFNEEAARESILNRAFYKASELVRERKLGTSEISLSADMITMDGMPMLAQHPKFEINDIKGHQRYKRLMESIPDDISVDISYKKSFFGNQIPARLILEIKKREPVKKDNEKKFKTGFQPP